MSLFVPEGHPPNTSPALTTFVYKVEALAVDTSELEDIQITYIDNLRKIKADAEKNQVILNVDPLLGNDCAHPPTNLSRKRKGTRLLNLAPQFN